MGNDLTLMCIDQSAEENISDKFTLHILQMCQYIKMHAISGQFAHNAHTTNTEITIYRNPIELFLFSYYTIIYGLF